MKNRPNSPSGREVREQSRLVLNKQRKHAVNTVSVRKFLSELALHQNKHSMAFSVVLIDDESMRTYNRKYRGFDKPTDVLSFCGDDDYLGDILISVETAFSQASQSRSLTLDSNIRRLALHGFLHLAGYDHETDNGEMRVIERRLRRRFAC